MRWGLSVMVMVLAASNSWAQTAAQDTKRLDALLNFNRCYSPPCDLSAGTKVGGYPIVTTATVPTGVSDGDKGDITVSGGGLTWNVDSSAIAFTELSGSASDAQVTGSAEENEIDLLDLQDGAVDNCAGSEIVRRNAGDTAFECVAAAGGFTSFGVEGDDTAVDVTITDGNVLAISGDTSGIDTEDGDAGADSVVISYDATEAATANEAAMALQDISGAVTDGQVPNTITIDLATVSTTANAGDSATAFFSSGEIADAQVSDTITASTSTLAAANDNDTSIATTSFVQQEIDDVDLLSDNCILENDSTPIPDSCVGDGSDAGGGGGGITYADAAAAVLAGF